MLTRTGLEPTKLKSGCWDKGKAVRRAFVEAAAVTVAE